MNLHTTKSFCRYFSEAFCDNLSNPTHPTLFIIVVEESLDVLKQQEGPQRLG